MRVSELLGEAEEDWTQKHILVLRDDVRFIAGKYGSTSEFWTEFNHASEAGKERIIQDTIEPLLAKHGYPLPHTEEYAKFQRDMIRIKM